MGNDESVDSAGFLALGVLDFSKGLLVGRVGNVLLPSLLDLPGLWVLGMEPEVEHQQVVHVVGCCCYRTSVGFGLGNGFLKQWFDFVCLVASDQKTVVEDFGPFPSVLLRGTECLDSK